MKRNVYHMALALLALCIGSCVPKFEMEYDSLRLDYTELSVAPDEDKVLLAIYYSGDWTVSVSEPWARAEKTSGSGNARNRILLDKNTGPARDAVITVEADNGEKWTVDLTQTVFASGYLRFEVGGHEIDKLEFPADALSYDVSVVSNMDESHIAEMLKEFAEAGRNAGFEHAVAEPETVGDGVTRRTLSLTLPENTGGDRTVKLPATISGTAFGDTLVVVQDAQKAYMSAPSQVFATKSENRYSIDIDHNLGVLAGNIHVDIRYEEGVEPFIQDAAVADGKFTFSSDEYKKNAEFVFTCGAGGLADLSCTTQFVKCNLISTAQELQEFLAAASGYNAEYEIELENDIDLSGYDLVPATSFAGTLSGAGFSLKNWNTTTALFNSLSGKVENLNIDASCSLEVQPTGNAAFIALENAGTITGCVNYGAVKSAEGVSFTSTEARMTGTIAAVSTGTVSSCANNGVITLSPASVDEAAVQFVGGIVGQASGASSAAEFISGCTNNGALSFTPSAFSSKLFIGGICGGTPAGAGTFGDYGIIRNSVNKGTVTLTASAMSDKNTYINLGGVVGYAEADLDGCGNEGDVTVTLPKNPESAAHNYQRPAIGGVAGTVLYNVSSCTNSGDLSVTGAFGTGTAASVGAGYFQRAYFGGVVAMAGSAAAENADAAYLLKDCANSGKITLDLDMYREENTYAHIGGVAGNAVSKVSGCTSEGEGLVISNRLKVGYAGGVIGLLGLPDNKVKGSLSGCSNKAPITYDAVNEGTVGNQSVDIYVGGVTGNSQYCSSNITNIHNYAGGDITVQNGPASGSCYVGGLTGFNGKVRITGSNSDDARLKSQGSISVDTPKAVSAGGIAGRTSNQILDVSVDNELIEVRNPGNGSMIGGICGDRQSGGEAGDARMKNVKTDIVVTNDNNSTEVYLGCWYGRRAETKDAFHTTSFIGSVTYPANVTFGFIAGHLASGAKMTVGGTGAKVVTIPAATVENGQQLGTLSSDALQGRMFGVCDGTVTYGGLGQ